MMLNNSENLSTLKQEEIYKFFN